MGASDEVKLSSVILNQLMAFGTVTATILTAAMQTASASGTVDSAMIFLTENIADISSGASGGISHSVECTVTSLGWAPALWKVQVLNSFFPMLLMAVFALFKGYKISLMVGINCFFPDFMAVWGKYAVCYRFEAESEHNLYGFQCPYLQNIPLAFALTLILVLFAATIGIWLRLSRHNPATAGERPPNHITFITRAYRKRYAYWETERLVRKTLLKLISAALPVTYSPSLQMLSVSLVLLSALSLYAVLKPYRSMSWNNLEICLLTAAVVMTCFTSCLLSNESHWGRSTLVQRLLLFCIAAIGGGLSCALAFKYSAEMLREARQPKKEASVEGASRRDSLEMVGPGTDDEKEAQPTKQEEEEPEQHVEVPLADTGSASVGP